MPLGGGGYLVLKRPWPAMLRTVFNDPDRYVETYWSRFPGMYFAGDGAKRDKDGYFWLLGRVDDVMNVSGHRLSTMEVESALVDHQAVAEAAVIGKQHEVKGQGICAFVSLITGVDNTPELVDELRAPRRQEDRRHRAPGRALLRRPSCPRPGVARSCAGCCGTSPTARPWATPPPWRTRRWSRS